MSTPAQLRHRANLCDKEGERLALAGDVTGAAKQFMRAELWRATAAEMDRQGMGRLPKPLPGANKARKIGTDMELAREGARARAGRPVSSDHPFPRRLEETGSSVDAWARKRGLPRKTVAAWYAPKPHGRRIPRKHAETIARELGIPADPENWPNGISDKKR